MIGDLYERASASLEALRARGVAKTELSIRGHPLAIRALAICFDRTRFSERWKECVIEPKQPVMWRDVPIFEDGKLRDPASDTPITDRIWIEIGRKRVILIEHDGFPRIDEACPEQHRATVLDALASFLPRAAT